jgi:AcrR family transcriptional regulator
VPRIAEVRDAAEPSSEEQRARHVRMLEAAAELASEKELARVQMHEVAKRAGVAIGTLYRYFPSKTHLFVAVMVDQIDQMGAGFSKGVASDTTPQDAVYNVLVRATRGLLRRPALSTAMIQSTSTANVATVPDAGKVDRAFRQIMLDAAGIEHPTEGDLTALRLVVQLWFGVVQSCLNGRISIPDAESDIRKGCDLLLVGLSRR